MSCALYTIVIIFTLMILPAAHKSEEMNKNQFLDLVLNQLRIQVSTRLMKQSIKAVKYAIQLNTYLDQRHDKSLMKLNCMVADFNDQITNITQSFRQQKSKVQDLNSKLGTSQQRVQELEHELTLLNKRVRIMEISLQFPRACSTRYPQLQQIKDVVQEFSNTKDWKALRRDLDAVLNHSSQDYTQLHDVDSVYRAASKGHIQLIFLLLCGGLPVDTATSYKHTMLHGAAFGGHLDVMELLLNLGATVDVRNQFEETPLIAAAQEGHLEEIQRLVRAGADTAAKDKSGKEAINYATQYNYTELEEYLKQLPHTLRAIYRPGESPSLPGTIDLI